MPWRGPEHPGDFPTLGYVVADWIEAYCVIPDGEDAGQPFILTNWQLKFLLWHYRLRPDAKAGAKPSEAFAYRRSLLVRPQKAGKGPLSAAQTLAEADGPTLFDGWDANGEPVGKDWASPWLQVAALSEGQTDNVWSALVPMVELGSLKGEIPDTGLSRINIAKPSGVVGKIEPVTSSAGTRLGQRITFFILDEPHLLGPHNGGTNLANTLRRNVAGMGGRGIETTNPWDPSEDSVAQQTYESGVADLFCDYPDPPRGSIRNKQERRKVLRAVYEGCPWVDLDRIDAEIEELLPRDPNQAERFYLNRIVAGAASAWEVAVWKALHNPDLTIAPGRKIVLGFDGSRRRDSTALIAVDVETGYMFVLGIWERPNDADEDWEIPEGEVNAKVAYAFKTWDVWRIYADPPYWETTVDGWAGEYGEDRVVAWWTNRDKAVAYAVKAFNNAIVDAELSHDGHEVLARHIGNAVRRKTKIKDPDEVEDFLWLIRKETPKSRRKIDGAMAAILAWEGRGEAVAAGVLNEPEYKRAVW